MTPFAPLPCSPDMVCWDCYRKKTNSLPFRFASWWNSRCGCCGEEMRLTYLENDLLIAFRVATVRAKRERRDPNKPQPQALP